MFSKHFLIALILGAACFPAARAEWHRFRGPNGSGLGEAPDLPSRVTEEAFRWKIDLPGAGHSSPVVWKDRILVTAADESTGQRLALCLSTRDGKQLWRASFPGPTHRKHRDNSFASATPVVDARHVYLAWGSPTDYIVVALDHDGKEVWRAPLEPYKAGHGFGASPILVDDVLVVPNDQDGKSSLVGLDALTGRLLWRKPREGKSSYITPCVYQPAGQAPQVIFTSWHHGVTSLDPRTGETLWEADVFDKGHVETPIGSPIVAGDLILASAGWLGVRMEVIAIRPPSKPGEKPTRVYCLDRSAPLCTTPLVKDDLLFLWSDTGIVTCASVRTGEVFWRQRVPGSYYSSPICLGDRLLNVSRAGDVVVLAVSRDYRLLGHGRLDEGTHSTPAVARGVLYVRTFSGLIAVGGK